MDNFYLGQAIELAVDSAKSGKGGPYGAIIVKNNEIISTGGNRVILNHDPTAHAEIIAIRQACNKLNDFQLTDCILYSSCEPCPMCLGAIYWARLDRVYYACNQQVAAKAGFDDSYIYDEISVAPAKRHIPMLHLRHSDSHKPFSVWAAQPDRINY